MAFHFPGVDKVKLNPAGSPPDFPLEALNGAPLKVTPEMRQAVAEEQCALRGHSWYVFEEMGRGPVGAFCAHCGKDSGLVASKDE